jgi:hypothetical protein
VFNKLKNYNWIDIIWSWKSDSKSKHWNLLCCLLFY